MTTSQCTYARLRLRIGVRGFGVAAFFPRLLLGCLLRSWRGRIVPCSAVSAATRASAFVTMSSIVVCRYCRMPPVVEMRLSSPWHQTTCS